MRSMLFVAIAGLALQALPAIAADIACDGPFAADSSEARLIETFGKDNVVTGDIDGPEGTTMLATTVFPNDPEKSFDVIWWDEAARQRISYLTLPHGDTAPGGVRYDMTLAEVRALNGEPFTLYGFWWDYGGAAGFPTGKLADLPGGCVLGVTFTPSVDLPEGVDPAPISGDQEIDSDLPLLADVVPKVSEITLGYPDFAASED